MSVAGLISPRSRHTCATRERQSRRRQQEGRDDRVLSHGVDTGDTFEQREKEQAVAERMLIRNAIVLTQDPSLGELPRADILVEGDTIAAVGPNLSAEGAEVIDAEGDIVIPGFI